MSKWSACSETDMQMKRVSILCQGISFIYETWILGTWPSLQCLCATFPSVHLPKHFWKYSTADSTGVLKKSGPAGCRFYTRAFGVILYIPRHRYVLLPVKRVEQSSLRCSPTCPPPILSEVHPRPTRPCSSFTQTWKQTPCFASRLPELAPTKGNGRNKKQRRVAEIMNSPTSLKCDGFFSKISGWGITSQTITLAR